MSNVFGPAFFSELEAAGLVGRSFSWFPDGLVMYGDDLTGAERETLDAVVAAHDPDKPAPPVVPRQVPASQGGIALIHFGLMDAVMAVVNAAETPATHKWAWDRATTWERDSPSFNYFADRAGISEQQKDDLFVFAGAVVP
ncbi:hypothetical protein D3C87_1256840 [compost metagenome]